MLQGLVQNKEWFFPSSACANTSPAGCSPFGLCCSVPSYLFPPFSVSHPVIYFTGHKFINRNFLSLVLTPFFFFFAWYHFSFLNKYNCPLHSIGDLITLGLLFQEEWRPCYFIYSFTCSFIQPTFGEHLLGVRHWVTDMGPSCADTHRTSKQVAVEAVLSWCPSSRDRGEFMSGAGAPPWGDESSGEESNYRSGGICISFLGGQGGNGIS